jgi:hypothetical protein
MESTSARDLDRRLADLVRSERHLVVQFVVELAGFAKRELYRELGYTSLFSYCVRRLNATVSAEFIAELEQVRVALSHKCPDGDFEQVVREAFKLVLEQDRKRKALTDRPRPQSETPGDNDRYVPAAVKRAVWERDQARCTWPMGDGEVCGTTHRLEFDHDLEVALGGKPTIGNVRLLCKSHNLMKAEQHLGRAFMAKFRKGCAAERDTS